MACLWLTDVVKCNADEIFFPSHPVMVIDGLSVASDGFRRVNPGV
jgi:hypothetical protein